MARTFFAILTLGRSPSSSSLGVLAAPLMVTVIAPGFTGPEAGADHPSRARALPRRRPPRRLGLVPRRPEQPRQVPPLVHRAGGLERRDDRHDGLLRRPSTGSNGWRWISRGARSLGSFLQFAVQAPMAFRLSRHPGRAALTAPVREAMRNFVPVLISRGAVQLTGVHRRRGSPAGCPTARWRRCRTRNSSTRCRSASSASRSPPRSCRRCRGTPPAPTGSRRCARASTPPSSGWPSSSSRPAVAFVALGDVIAGGAFCSAGASRPPTPSTCGGFSRDRRWGCSPARWRGLYSVAHYAIGDAKKPLRFAMVAARRRRRRSAMSARSILPADARHRAAMGRGGADGVVGRRRLDRVRAAPRQPQSARRPHRTRRLVLGAPLDRRTGRRPHSRGA